VTVDLDHRPAAQGKLADPLSPASISAKTGLFSLTLSWRLWISASRPGPGASHRSLCASTPFFAAQYRIVGFDHPNVELRREGDFKSDLIELVAGFPFVLFVVDDTVFVGDASLATSMSILGE